MDQGYRPGKFHLIHFGDTLKDSRYRIIRKLGYGCFSTELAILDALSQSTSKHPGKNHVMTMVDSFEHKNPNGVHRCLAFDVMGPSRAGALKESPKGVTNPSSERTQFPIWMVKSILYQTLLGIDFLHRSGVAHGDLQQGNLLFSVKDLNAPLTQYIDVDPRFCIKCSDLGGAFFLSDPPPTLVTPVALRSPELLFENKVNKVQDVWIFGCLIFELFTGRHLVLVTGMGNREEVDDDHFLQFNVILGPVPPSLRAKYPRAHIYYNEKGEQVKNYIGELPDGFDPGTIEASPTVEHAFDTAKPADMGVEEAHVIKGLLRWILDYDPAKRPLASEFLEHPWFSAVGSSLK
ncbi:kinase-like domain-containing protein [Aspergillus cavernicola]|uniref:Kinase-like domain-containing protein n=1 Tax=Aspergillus cavernicola TaxID=176166 RepID=A0ABR4J5Q4_9EURO